MKIFSSSNGIAGAIPARPTVTSYRAAPRGHFVAFLDVQFEDGTVLRDLCLFEKDGRRWVNFPTREIKRANGKVDYKALIDIVVPEAYWEFQRVVLEAVAPLVNKATA